MKRGKFNFSPLIILFCLLFHSHLFAEEIRITNVRLWQSPKESQLVIDFNAKPNCSPVEFLNNGTAYFDLINVIFSLGSQTFKLRNPFIDAITIQKKGNANLRVYFRCSTGVRFQTFLLPKTETKPDRIVIFMQEPLKKQQGKASLKTIAKNLEAFYNKSRRGIVTILSFSAAGQMIGQGTGFFVSNGCIVTNLHVIENASSLFAKDFSGTLLPIKIVSVHSKNIDIALLKMESNRMESLPICKRESQIGQKVFVIGSPLGFEGTLTDGIISAIRNDNTPTFQISAPISPGSSGSPVFNEYGEVIGVATSKAINGELINFAIPIQIALSGLFQ